eukprot:1160436-Pelagomonas_calceolata.AAC.12
MRCACTEGRHRTRCYEAACQIEEHHVTQRSACTCAQSLNKKQYHCTAHEGPPAEGLYCWHPAPLCSVVTRVRVRM